jgi:hypothetical protein
VSGRSHWGALLQWVVVWCLVKIALPGKFAIYPRQTPGVWGQSPQIRKEKTRKRGKVYIGWSAPAASLLKVEEVEMKEHHQSKLIEKATSLGAVIESVEMVTPPATKSPVSPGFIALTVNEDKAKFPHLHNITPDKLGYAVMVVGESQQVESFLDYLENLEDKRVLVNNLADGTLAKLIKPADASRYFTTGRKRIQAKIFKRLGRWYNCPGLLLSLTFDPGKISRVDAWKLVGKLRREFMNRVNRWRRRAGIPKAKYLSVIEAQPGTGYPHVHLVFPHLKRLAPLAFLIETWGQASNSVDIKVKDSISPVSYVCKYVSKIEGWSSMALSYIWTNHTRLYSMSRDYVLPDYSDKRVPEWQFQRCLSKGQALNMMINSLSGFETLLGADDIVNEILKRGSSS